jgi:hypothetical protein|mmetsp:Transcript_65612/g.109323  ORF Transcript_65612/g.109323 Transcript_65612/m.109323 type:complete len:97 (-) Transcript_65612:825-1115(-)
MHVSSQVEVRQPRPKQKIVTDIFLDESPLYKIHYLGYAMPPKLFPRESQSSVVGLKRARWVRAAGPVSHIDLHKELIEDGLSSMGPRLFLNGSHRM